MAPTGIDRRAVRTVSNEIQDLRKVLTEPGDSLRVVLAGSLERTSEKSLGFSTEAGLSNAVVSSLAGSVGAQLDASRVIDSLGESRAIWFVDVTLNGATES